MGGFLTPQILSIALKLFPVSVELKSPLSCGEKLRCDCVAVSINNETFPDVCNRVLKRKKASGVMRFCSGGRVAHNVLIYVADVLTGHCGRSGRERLSWTEGAARMYPALITTSNETHVSPPLKSNYCFLVFV